MMDAGQSPISPQIRTQAEGGPSGGQPAPRGGPTQGHPLLELRKVTRHYALPRESLLRPAAVVQALQGVSLQVTAGRSMGIVGESGSGKSVTMMALMGLIGYPGQVRAQSLRFAGQDLLGLSDRQRRSLVGKDVAMIFQDPTTSLNPCFTVGFQLVEALRLHLKLDKAAARRRATELLEQVGIPAAASRLNSSMIRKRKDM